SLPQRERDGNVYIVERATVTSIIFNEQALAEHIIPDRVLDFQKEVITPKGISELQFEIKDKETFNPENTESIIFTLKGEVNNVSTFDKKKMKSDLAGVKA